MLNLKIGPSREKYLECVNGGNAYPDLQPNLQAYNTSLKPTQAKYQLDLDLYPEPFAGNANALVYILSGNPGLAPNNQDFDLMKSNGLEWNEMMLNSYDPFPNTATGHNPTLYWLDPKWNAKIQPLHNGYKGGFDWWKPRTRKLRDAIKDRAQQLKLNNNPADKLHKRLFNIDYHPYHSKNLRINNHIKSLQSMQEVNNILKRALDPNAKDSLYDQKRLFIIVRCRKLWEDRLKRILNSTQLPHNVIMLKNPRCAYLTENNMIINNTRNDWNRLVDTLTY